MKSRFLILLPAIAGMASLSASAMGAATIDSTQGRLLRIVNATDNSATTVATAAAGKDDFIDLPLGAPIRGGLADATVRVTPGACLRDVRVTFGSSGASVLHNIDVCRVTGIRLVATRY